MERAERSIRTLKVRVSSMVYFYTIKAHAQTDEEDGARGER